MKQITAALSVFVCSLSFLFAQADANKGRIVGTVFDAKQAVVPNATVRIKNLGRGQAREVKTSATGQYQAVQLDPGQYEVVAEAPGFAATTLQGVTVTVGSALGLDLTLQVQGTTTTVEVSEAMMSATLPAPTTTVNYQKLHSTLLQAMNSAGIKDRRQLVFTIPLGQ